MKIALTCPASLPATQFGGILFLGIHIAKHLSNDGHNLTIYTSDLDFANNASTFNKKLPSQEKIGNFLIKRTHVWFSTFLFYVNPGMYKQMLNDDLDIIHAIGIRSFQAFIAALVSKRKNIPLVISDQGGLTTHPNLKESSFIKRILIEFQKPLIKFIIGQASKIVVANDYEKKIFQNFCNESKIIIIKNGIDLDILSSTKVNFKSKYNINQEYILFLGRFDKIKGIDTLIESINIIKSKIDQSKIKFLLMGVDFGFESKMIKMIKNYDLENIIKIIKNPPRDDVIGAYRESKFLVYPSRWELSPLTPLEGFAFKKTVISSTAHGIPSTIQHNKNCILVEPENPIQLSESILELITNEKKCVDLGNSGYDLVIKQCNSENMAKQTLETYQQIIKESSSKTY
jgi:glycosyltransferase involved in cell wall biosynthesis